MLQIYSSVNLFFISFRFQAGIFSTWEPSLKLVEEQLNKPLFKECDQSLILNFAPQVINLVFLTKNIFNILSKYVFSDK